MAKSAHSILPKPSRGPAGYTGPETAQKLGKPTRGFEEENKQIIEEGTR